MRRPGMQGYMRRYVDHYAANLVSDSASQIPERDWVDVVAKEIGYVPCRNAGCKRIELHEVGTCTHKDPT